MGVFLVSMDVKQAFDNVTMRDIVRELHVNAALTAAILREQLGGKCDVCCQETKVTHVSFDKSL